LLATKLNQQNVETNGAVHLKQLKTTIYNIRCDSQTKYKMFTIYKIYTPLLNASTSITSIGSFRTDKYSSPININSGA